MREQCTQSKNCQKIVTRHVGADYLDTAEDFRYTPQKKAIYRKRAETIERVFADAKKTRVEIHHLAWQSQSANAGFAYFRLHEFKKSRDMRIKGPWIQTETRLFIPLFPSFCSHP